MPAIADVGVPVALDAEFAMDDAGDMALRVQRDLDGSVEVRAAAGVVGEAQPAIDLQIHGAADARFECGKLALRAREEPRGVGDIVDLVMELRFAPERALLVLDRDDGIVGHEKAALDTAFRFPAPISVAAEAPPHVPVVDPVVPAVADGSDLAFVDAREGPE